MTSPILYKPEIPVLEESVLLEFARSMQSLCEQDPANEPLRTIRRTWSAEIKKENPYYTAVSSAALVGLSNRYPRELVYNLVDCSILSYMILKKQAKKNGSRMPIIEEDTLRKVNSEYHLSVNSLITASEDLLDDIERENNIYGNYILRTVLNCIPHETLQKETIGFLMFCYTLFKEQVKKDKLKN
ncbi:MAG: hypothetical protein AABY07_05565 [Nanoarchaeota archaeon]